MSAKESTTKNQIISHLTLRTLIGLIGILLPIILPIGLLIIGHNEPFQDSISDYYGTEVRNFFVGFLFVLSFYLLSYKGHDNDNAFANFGALFALFTAIFPTTSADGFVRGVHLTSAGLLFAVFIYFALVIFKRPKKTEWYSAMKAKRNNMYTACGIIMIVAIATAAGSFFLLSEEMRRSTNIIFWSEAVALWAFGYCWLVKGQMFWKDVPVKE